jgi:hypothetical protein
MSKKKYKFELSENEAKVIALWRGLEYGTITLKIQDGIPQDVLNVEHRVDLKKDDFTKWMTSGVDGLKKYDNEI